MSEQIPLIKRVEGLERRLLDQADRIALLEDQVGIQQLPAQEAVQAKTPPGMAPAAVTGVPKAPEPAPPPSASDW